MVPDKANAIEQNLGQFRKRATVDGRRDQPKRPKPKGWASHAKGALANKAHWTKARRIDR
jgi:hypothetical protein